MFRSLLHSSTNNNRSKIDHVLFLPLTFSLGFFLSMKIYIPSIIVTFAAWLLRDLIQSWKYFIRTARLSPRLLLQVCCDAHVHHVRARMHTYVHTHKVCTKIHTIVQWTIFMISCMPRGQAWLCHFSRVRNVTRGPRAHRFARVNSIGRLAVGASSTPV